jgi:hypothetical protein
VNNPESNSDITLYVTIRDDVSDWIIEHGLSKTESKLFFYFLRIDRFGDRPAKIKVAEILLATGVGKTAYHSAIAKLHKTGLLPDWFEIETYDNPEYQVVQKLKDKLGGQTEVVTAIGRIDLLTETEIIEVKQVSDWKAALGQILTYSAFFPEHTKRIHLFGDCTPEKKQVICSTVSSFGVIATFEGVKDE